MASEESVGAKRGVERGEIQDSAPAMRAGEAPALGESANDVPLREDSALSLLKSADVAPETLEQLAKNGALLTYRKVKLALVEHPRTPRHVSLPLIRQLYTIDLMQVALTPAVPADVKRAADEALCNRIETLASGERLTLAHRGSGRIAEALLLDAEARVTCAALQNSRLTEAGIIRALIRPGCSAPLVEAVCHHPQWSLRREVRVALLRNEKTPMARAVEFARGLPPALLREILHSSRLPANVKEYLLADLVKRGCGRSG